MIPNIRRLKRRIKDRLWRLRLRLAYHLVGVRSFAANLDIVGAIHLTRMTFGAPMVRDIYVFETAKIRNEWLRIEGSTRLDSMPAGRNGSAARKPELLS